jgi:hypothetical protein
MPWGVQPGRRREMLSSPVEQESASKRRAVNWDALYRAGGTAQSCAVSAQHMAYRPPDFFGGSEERFSLLLAYGKRRPLPARTSFTKDSPPVIHLPGQRHGTIRPGEPLRSQDPDAVMRPGIIPGDAAIYHVLGPQTTAEKRLSPSLHEYRARFIRPGRVIRILLSAMSDLFPGHQHCWPAGT